MSSSTLSLGVSLSRPCVLPGAGESEPLYVLLRVRCSGVQAFRRSGAGQESPHPSGPQTPEHLNTRTPEHLTHHLALLLDASGSMYRIVLDEAERAHWRRLGEERGDLKLGRVDGRQGWLWSGRTLREMQARHGTAMQAALRALVRADERLRPGDRLTAVAFADHARRFISAADSDRHARIEATVAALSSGVETSGLGDGTRLAEALRLALEDAGGPLRLLLISDGLLEDRVACSAWVERIAEAGNALSCIGVGDQFDEEWLMWAADATRGRFCYAPTAEDLEAAVAQELARLESLSARRVTLTLRPLRGALFRDLCQVAPDLSALHRVETDGASYCFSLGDLSADQEALFAAELVLPDLPPGLQTVLSVELSGTSSTGEPLDHVTADAVVHATTNLSDAFPAPLDLEAVAAVHAYRAERRAQRALRRGQLGEATRHLRDTRQIVERLGREELAAELEKQAAAVEAGARSSPEREKRIKAGTRRLVG